MKEGEFLKSAMPAAFIQVINAFTFYWWAPSVACGRPLWGKALCAQKQNMLPVSLVVLPFQIYAFIWLSPLSESAEMCF